MPHETDRSTTAAAVVLPSWGWLAEGALPQDRLIHQVVHRSSHRTRFFEGSLTVNTSNVMTTTMMMDGDG